MHRLPAILILASAVITAQVITSQITSQNDNARTGANTHETVLTPPNVSARQFGKLFGLRVEMPDLNPIFSSNSNLAGAHRAIV